MDKPIILIADDEPHLRLLVSATLGAEEYSVIEAGDGEQAWEIIRRARPAVVLLDVQMPGRSGLEVVRLIKADAELRDTSVVMLTSKAQPADIAAGRAAGADHYLTKPFSPLELVNLIDRISPR